MARPYVRSIKPYEAKEIFGNLSQSNHYQVSFTNLPSAVSTHITTKFGVQSPDSFMSRRGGLLCSDASLPSSSLATGEVRSDFMGIPQEFAHTRLYTDIDFTFYIDNDYSILRIFEGWIDYVSSGSSNEIDELSDNYYRRMRYPDSYKTQSMFISKFEKDYGKQLDYMFINAFPKLTTAVPVSYGGADILKVSVSFNYDRYIVNPKGRIRPNEASFDPLRQNDLAFSEFSETTNFAIPITTPPTTETETSTPPTIETPETPPSTPPQKQFDSENPYAGFGGM